MLLSRYVSVQPRARQIVAITEPAFLLLWAVLRIHPRRLFILAHPLSGW